MFPRRFLVALALTDREHCIADRVYRISSGKTILKL